MNFKRTKGKKTKLSNGIKTNKSDSFPFTKQSQRALGCKNKEKQNRN